MTLRISIILILLSSSLSSRAQVSNSNNPVLESLESMTSTKAKAFIDSGFVYILYYGKPSFDETYTSRITCQKSICPKYGFQYLHTGTGCILPKKIEKGFNIYNATVKHHLLESDPKWEMKLKKELDACEANQSRNTDPLDAILIEDCQILFERETEFEIYDSFGTLVKKGFANLVNLSELEKGIYYLNHAGRSDKFVRPRKCR